MLSADAEAKAVSPERHAVAHGGDVFGVCWPGTGGGAYRPAVIGGADPAIGGPR